MGSSAKQLVPIAATAAGAYFGGPLLAGAMGSATGGAIAGGALGQLAGTLLSGGPELPASSAPAPVVETPPAMPTPDDAAVQAARRRAVATQRQRSGRQSTILTAVNDGDTLG